MVVARLPCESVSAAEQLARERMAAYDPSHDFLHIQRVRRMALKIADSLNGEVDPLVVELGAILHDYMDHKYMDPADAVASETELADKLDEAGLDRARRELVLRIVRNVGYSKEKKLKAAGAWTEWHETCKEYHCVQDADRLDAIGGMGILRVAAYSGAHGQPLFDSDNHDVIDHFHDKLFFLKDTMRTPMGRRVAARRQAIMEEFVRRCELEGGLEDFEIVA